MIRERSETHLKMTLYFDKDFEKKIQDAAKNDQSCISQWFEEAILSFLEGETHLIELLAEAKNFNSTLRKLKSMKYAYKLSDESYLFGWSICTLNENCQSIDWDSIEVEARELRKKLKKARLKKV